RPVLPRRHPRLARQARRRGGRPPRLRRAVPDRVRRADAPAPGPPRGRRRLLGLVLLQLRDRGWRGRGGRRGWRAQTSSPPVQGEPAPSAPSILSSPPTPYSHAPRPLLALAGPPRP